MDRGLKKYMNESFEIVGYWYTPGQDMEKDGVSGVLKYTPDSITLDLIGIFEGAGSGLFAHMNNSSNKKIIYGYSNFGERLTLIDCTTKTSISNAPGFETITYTVNRFFVGTKIIDDVEAAFVEDCTFSLTYLNAWLDYDIIETRHSRDSGAYELHVNFDKAMIQKNAIEILSKQIKLTEEADWFPTKPKDYLAKETHELSLDRFYRIQPSTEGSAMTFTDCFDNLQFMRRLLAMLMGTSTHFLYIETNLETTQETEFDGTVYEKKNRCRMFFTQVGDINKVQNISPNKRNTLLIPRRDIKNQMGTVFNLWFSLQEELSEIVNPFISDYYLPSYQETRFLNTVRCLETFHRNFLADDSSNSRDTGSDFELQRQEMLAFINENVAEKYKQDFISRITFNDEGSLQKRLKYIYRNTPVTLTERLFGKLTSANVGKVTKIITDTRNYYTHRDDKKKYPLAIDTLSTLNIYIDKLNVILQFWILKQIGMDPTILEKRLVDFSRNYSAFFNKLDLR